MSARLHIRQQSRQSLALRVTPAGLLVLIPQHLSPDSPEVQAFIRNALEELRMPSPPNPLSQVWERGLGGEGLTRDDVLALVDICARQLEVEVGRVQLRPMRNKWGSVSTVGTLTLADDLLRLPRPLVEYVVLHELLHLRVPGHGRLYRLLLSQHIPDWRDRERCLARYTLLASHA
jgi:hypothetical protein